MDARNSSSELDDTKKIETQQIAHNLLSLQYVCEGGDKEMVIKNPEPPVIHSEKLQKLSSARYVNYILFIWLYLPI